MCPKDFNLEHKQGLNSYFLLVFGNFEIKALHRTLIHLWFILAQATSRANSDDSCTVSYHSNPLATMVISSRSSESGIHLLLLSHHPPRYFSNHGFLLRLMLFVNKHWEHFPSTLETLQKCIMLAQSHKQFIAGLQTTWDDENILKPFQWTEKAVM